MPIYEYICTNDACAHELEALQKVSDEPLVFCPSCGEQSLKKKISAAAFRLKGTGWYETDFKNNGKKPAAKDASKDSAKDGGGESKTATADSGGKSETKSDSKSDSKKPAGGGSTAAA